MFVIFFFFSFLFQSRWEILFFPFQNIQFRSPSRPKIYCDIKMILNKSTSTIFKLFLYFICKKILKINRIKILKKISVILDHLDQDLDTGITVYLI